MTMTPRIQETHRLCIRANPEVQRELSSLETLYAVLLTAWSEEDLAEPALDRLIVRLRIAGASGFVCVGPYSEEMHDRVDDILDDYSDQAGESQDDVFTTYHNDESADDCAAFFLAALPSGADRNGVMLAVLSDEGSEETENLRRCLLAHAQ